MRLPHTVLVFALFLLPLAAHAGSDHIITQKGKKFSSGEISITAGDTVTFVNDDKLRHNVYSRTKGHKFKIKKQKPGDEDSITFDSAGAIDVRCAIHPKMKLMINVSD